MAFDRVALKQVMEKYNLKPIECSWLDSARVARRAWPDKFAWKGYLLCITGFRTALKPGVSPTYQYF